MKHIFVFVDFSPTAIQAFDQALAIAIMHGSTISVCHIVENLNPEYQTEIELKMQPFIEVAEKSGVRLSPVIVKGELFKTAKEVVTQLKPDLIVVGTHGTDGIHLRLFGSAIHKLVREVPAPSLVLGKACKPIIAGFKKILVPSSSQPSYLITIKLACDLLALDGEITLFSIEALERDADLKAMANMDEARTILDSRNVRWKFVEIKAKPHQIGSAAQTLDYIRSENIEMLAINAEISERFKHFGKLDKEAILLNEDGILVLCVNKHLI